MSTKTKRKRNRTRKAAPRKMDTTAARQANGSAPVSQRPERRWPSGLASDGLPLAPIFDHVVEDLSYEPGLWVRR